ncbi:MAG: hypothetical protein ACEPOZ_09710 [Marinifilaceae bacterium]
MRKKVVEVQSSIVKKGTLQKLFFEFIAAFMGVLIAMGLSNWQQNRKENNFIRRSVASIYKDNSSNIESMKAQLTNLNTHLDTFKFYRNDENFTILDVINKSKYLILQSLQSDGWEILERSNLIYKLDYDVASHLSNLEDQTEIIKARRKGITDILYSSPYSTASDDKKTMRINLNGLKSASSIYLERALFVDSLLQISYGEYLAVDSVQINRKEL